MESQAQGTAPQQSHSQSQSQSSTAVSVSSSPAVGNPNFRPSPWLGSPVVQQYHSQLAPPSSSQPASVFGMIGSQQQPPQQQQLRPAAGTSTTMRFSSPNTLPLSHPQNFQGHNIGILRGSSSIGLPTTVSAPPTSTSSQHHQPWLSQPGRPPLPSPTPAPALAPSTSHSSFRPSVPVPVPVPMHRRPHTPQQLHPQPLPPSQPQQVFMSSTHQQQQQPPTPQQLQQQQPPPPPQQQQKQSNLSVSSSIQSHENYAQAQLRTPQPVTNQQQIARVQGSVHHRPPSTVTAQPTIVHSVPTDKTQSADPSESCDRILSKRNIQELLNQVDPSEKLDPEVEDVLVDIAEDFIDSVTTFGCSLAKHRKSSMLEAKDILLHLERTWNMTLPGFGGDEIKTYKKPVVNDIHKERLAVIKKSQTGAEVNKSSGGQAAGNVKGHLAKA